MSSVDQQVACPQCGGAATSSFQTRTGVETLHCARCGYQASTEGAGSREAGHGTLTVAANLSGSTIFFLQPSGEAQRVLFEHIRLDEQLAFAFLRQGPDYRAVFLRGEPAEGLIGLREGEAQFLKAAFAPYGEILHACHEAGGTLYTRHAEQPGYRVFSAYRDETGTLHISRPGDQPSFFTLRPGHFQSEDDAAEQIRLA